MVGLASNALVLGRSPAFLTGRMAPFAVKSFLIGIFHGTTEIDTFAIVKVEIRVTGQTLVLAGPITTLTIFVASGTNFIGVNPETNWTFRDTRGMSSIVEGQKVEVMLTNCAISETTASDASRVAFSAGSALIVREITIGASG